MQENPSDLYAKWLLNQEYEAPLYKSLRRPL